MPKKKAPPRKPPKPRNVAAKALAMGQFQPKVEANPNAYRRRPKHKPVVVPPADDDSGDGNN